MQTLSKQQLDQVIGELKTTVRDFPISKEALVKFTDSKEDQEFLSYVHGHGGYIYKFLAAFTDIQSYFVYLSKSNQ